MTPKEMRNYIQQPILLYFIAWQQQNLTFHGVFTTSNINKSEQLTTNFKQFKQFKWFSLESSWNINVRSWNN